MNVDIGGIAVFSIGPWERNVAARAPAVFTCVPGADRIWNAEELNL